MQEFIALENIKRFQAQLDACTDDAQRAVLTQLLEAEKMRLKTLLTAKNADRDGTKGNS